MALNTLNIPKVSLACKFKVQVIRNDESIKYDGPWFNNVVLDTGLDAIGTNVLNFGRFSTFSNMYIGSGDTPPDKTDVGLSSYIAGTGCEIVETDIVTSDNEVPYREDELFSEFGVGSFDNEVDVREVGIGQSQDALFNRQLLRDEEGNPVTVTVASDEGLRIYAKVRRYGFAPPDQPLSITFQYDEQEIEALVYQETGIFSQGNWYVRRVGPIRLETVEGSSRSPSSMSTEDYVSGSFSRHAEAIWNAGKFNDESVNALKITMVRSNTGLTSSWCRIEFQEAIGPISDIQELKLTVTRSWGRYEE